MCTKIAHFVAKIGTIYFNTTLPTKHSGESSMSIQCQADTMASHITKLPTACLTFQRSFCSNI